MFEKRTVFVVGAGASHEYKLPVGEELTEEIVKLLRRVELIYNNRVQDPSLAQGVQAVAGGSVNGIFMNKLAKLRSGLLHSTSIDRFLYLHNDDRDILRLGKFAITKLIIQAESESTLKVGAGKTLDQAGINSHEKNHWLKALFEQMQYGVQISNLKDIFNNISFICFNYDRCIEHYLFHAVKELGMLDAAQAAEIMEGLRIFHPYGSLGPLDWAPPSSSATIEFGLSDPDWRIVVSASNSINTFMEKMEDKATTEEIRNDIKTADQIIFLGFGFLEQNITLITPDGGSHANTVYATVYKESLPNSVIHRENIEAMLQRGGLKTSPPPTVFALDEPAGKFMREHGMTLRR